MGYWQDAYTRDANTEEGYVSRVMYEVPSDTQDLLVFPGRILTTEGRPAADRWSWDSNIWMKYFNGRFFLNAEVNHFYQVESGRGVAQGTAPNFRVRQNRDQDAWLYGVELGGLAGPAKLTFNYVRATGDDPSTRKTSEDASVGGSGVSSCYINPWGYLMYEYYGTGSAWDAAGKGAPTNFHHVGARIDYALAANLNLWAVYSRAWRDQPNAFRLAGDDLHRAHDFDNDDILDAQGGGTVVAVPQHANDIGAEIGLGVDWKLLEQFTWKTKVSWWQPGSWWSYAYPNTTMIYANTPIGPGPPPYGYALAPDQALARRGLGRSIDPLLAVETQFLVEF
jgi:predicted porin